MPSDLSPVRACVVEAGLDDPRVVALLRVHLDAARANAPVASVHALDLRRSGGAT